MSEPAQTNPSDPSDPSGPATAGAASADPERVDGVGPRIVGLANLLYGLVGLWVTFAILWRQRTEGLAPEGADPRTFVLAFGSMATVTLFLSVAFLAIGVQLLRRRRRWLGLAIDAIVALLVYMMALIPLAMSLRGAGAVSAAGYAAGGLVPPLLTLYPLWGWPWLAAMRRRSGDGRAGPATVGGERPGDEAAAAPADASETVG